LIPYGRQEVTQEDIDAVVRVLQSDFITQGPMVPKFEKAIASYTGADFATAVTNATSALHIACLALDLGAGDRLWTSPITFVASANCALYCGAEIDFVDIDPLTFNMCPEALERKLIRAKAENALPKIVVPVHLCGQSCDMERIAELAIEYDFKVIEDASHAIGGRYLDSPIGGCQFSDITIFSFHPVKIITTAEGGMALTNDQELNARLELYRSHGITRDRELMQFPSDNDWYYEQVLLGYNYRMTDLQAALGLSQLGRLDRYVAQRNTVATYYRDSLSGLPIKLPKIDSRCYSAYHLFVIRLQSGELASSHSEVFRALRSQNIGVNLHYSPVHLQPYYRKLGFGVGDFPIAEAYSASAISLPMFPTLSPADQENVISVLTGLLS